MTTLHILLVTPAYPPFPGGGERYVGSLARELARRGHHLTVITTTARLEKDFWQGRPLSTTDPQPAPLTIIRCGLPGLPGGRSTLLAWRKLMVMVSLLPGSKTAVLARMARAIPPVEGLSAALSAAATRRPVDLVHGFNISWEHPLVAASQWARQQKIPYAVTPFAHFGQTTGQRGLRDRVALNATMDHQRQLMSQAAAVLTLTAVERSNLRRYGVQSRHMDVIGGGLDPLPERMPATAELLTRYQITTPYFLFIGRANHDKGALHAVAATLQFRQRQEPVSAVFIGQTTAAFDRLVDSLSVEERQWIRPLGILDEAEKHALLAGCTGLLLPSQSDSFGIVFLEAWAHGRPVIGAAAGGIPGVVDHDQNGLLVPFGDVPALAKAMDQLLTDPARGKTMGQKGRQKVADQYTWSRVADRVLQTYQNILAERQTAASQNSE